MSEKNIDGLPQLQDEQVELFMDTVRRGRSEDAQKILPEVGNSGLQILVDLLLGTYDFAFARTNAAAVFIDLDKAFFWSCDVKLCDKVVDALIILLSDGSDGVISQNAALALGSIGGNRAVAALIQAFKNHYHPSIIYALGKNKENEQAIKALVHILASDGDLVRFDVIEALKDTYAEKTVELLLPLLQSKDNNIRYAVIDILGNIGSLQLLPTLYSIQENDTVPYMRDYVTIAINQIKQRQKNPG